MNFAVLAIGWCLLGQAAQDSERYSQPVIRPRQQAAPPTKLDEPATETPSEPPLEPPAADRSPPPAEGEGEGHVAPPAGSARGKVRPPELLAQALQKPKEGALVGTPLTLHAALARSNDRQQQLKIAQAYWRLCTAQADYHWSLDQRDRLAHFTRAHTNAAGTLSARAAARADVRDAQLAVAQSQEDLAELLGTHAEVTPPLASDRPHVGDYHTYYDTIFGNRQPPPRIRLIHRTLSVRRQAIDAHAEAIVAALDALEATGEHFQKSGQGLATILATLDELKQERRSFMADVRDYNQEFAEYAFATAPPRADSKTLVEMLILTSPREAPRRAPPARDNDPAGEGRASEADQAGSGPHEAEERAAQYQHDAAGRTADEPGPYQGLLGIADAPQRVQRLSNLLHWDRNLPSDAGEPASLADCLRGVPPQERLKVIAAFWRTREGAARYQALNEQLEQLNVLPSIAIGLRDQPGMVEASVRLQAARRAVHAAVLDAHVALLVAQFGLMQSAGRRLDEPWLLPSTAPQSGRYLVAPASATPGNSRARYWSEMVRLEHGKLEERADAVIQADIHRAALVNETRQGAHANAADADDEPMLLDSALRAIVRENQQTLVFLRDLTAYNMAIAHYVLATVSDGLSGEELAKRLAIARSTRRET